MLRKIRMWIGIIMLASITFLFTDIGGFAATHLGWLAKIQFLPALLSGAFATIIVILLATLLLGRVYCSAICPLGLLQDLFARLGLKAKPRRYSFSKEKRALRLSILAVFIISFAAGLNAIVSLLAPYSAFGRIAQNLLQPLFLLANNLAALIDESAGGYNVAAANILPPAIPVLIIASLTLACIAFLAWRNGRTYCNTICPVGTILAYVAKFSILAPHIDPSKCGGCKLCEKNCKAACINIKPKGQEPHIDKSRCVTCFNCIDNCKRGAISYRWRRPSTKPAAQANHPQPDEAKRAFLTSLGVIAATAATAQHDKLVDGGLTVIEKKTPPRRSTPLVPPGSHSLRHFSRHCTACQLCVSKCPNGVLRPSTDLTTIMQPHMTFENGYCRPDCNICSQICPAGAILPTRPENKVSTQIGHAVWIADRCVVNTDNGSCGNCARHCPNGAIQMIKNPNNPNHRIPAVNEERCIGCGACEYVCPARPLSAIFVEGHENHKEV